MEWLYILGGLLLIVIIYALFIYNKFVGLRNKYEEAFATIDVYSKKRYDLIPNLVETVKGYAKHEAETLTQVIEARNKAMGSSSIEESQTNERALDTTLRSLFALAESYPDLKANENFLDLQSKLASVESELASSRKYFNAVIKLYNTLVEKIPSSFVARMFGFPKQAYYEVEAEARESVRVSF